MTSIGNIIRVNFNKVEYGKRLDDFLLREIKNPQPEYNILTQTAVSMQANIYDVEVNYYSNRITMDSDSGEVVIDNRCSACIFHTTGGFIG